LERTVEALSASLAEIPPSAGEKCVGPDGTTTQMRGIYARGEFLSIAVRVAGMLANTNNMPVCAIEPYRKAAGL
jgi:hypothetical protein